MSLNNMPLDSSNSHGKELLSNLDEVGINLSRMFPERLDNREVAKFPEDVKFNVTEVEILTAIVQILFMTENALPTYDEILEKSGLPADKVKAVLKSDYFCDRMWARGIQWPRKWDSTQAITTPRAQITPQQVHALQIVMDPTNNKPMGQKLKMAGVSYSTWQNWLRQPVFAEAVRYTTEQMLGDNIATVHARLVNKADQGDVQAMKLFYEVSGRHDPARQQMQDIQSIIGLLLEVITRHITDPSVLMRITNDFDTVTSGGRIKTLDSVPANYTPDEAPVDAEIVSDDFFEFEEE